MASTKQLAREFEITVLGRTLEHLGTQMYKRRDIAIAELVANAWDAGATSVEITLPDPAHYRRGSSTVVVRDNGSGMTPDQVDHEYLVIGRNRRAVGAAAPFGRRIMGRKGVGKLAGFGLGRTMTLQTWRDGLSTTVVLDAAALKAEEGRAETLKLDGFTRAIADDGLEPTGTIVTMAQLKHKTPPDISGLHQAISRRFSRTVVGEMAIKINGEDLRAPDLRLSYSEPALDEGKDETTPGSLNTETLEDGEKVLWWAGFSDKVLPTELQGFTVLVNGKTAQAPPFFFNVEGRASGQHGTKYLTGVIEADFLDSGEDDESDRISTDRQEIDWDDEATLFLKQWGDKLTRRFLRERSDRKEDEVEKNALDDPQLGARIKKLDPLSVRQARTFIRALGKSPIEPERALELAGAIVQAFEYSQFYSYIAELEAVIEDPEQFQQAVSHISGWKVLESRAILEVVKGRIEILEKFFTMIINDAPETAHKVGDDNMHDLIGSYPWLINPEWQVLSEEKTITKQLREWGVEEALVADRTRYDFLAMEGSGQFVVIEIKRSGHAATLEDLQQLERYVNKLSDGRPNIIGVFITSERYALNEHTLKAWMQRDDIRLFKWSDLYERTKNHYKHYKAILDSDLESDDFARKAREVAKTRGILDAGTSYRDKNTRAEGIGPQDASFDNTATENPKSEKTE